MNFRAYYIFEIQCDGESNHIKKEFFEVIRGNETKN